MNYENYSCDGQMSIFDFLRDEFNPIQALALRGTGFHGGIERVKSYFSESHSLKEKAKFLKAEYGTGGFSSPIKKPCYIHEMNTYTSGKDIVFEYYDENMQNIESLCSWEKLANTISEMIANGKY